MTEASLEILAGPQALQAVRERGLRAEDVAVVPGASGGPKWFVLYGLDRALYGEFFRQEAVSVSLVGSSSGSWRFACAAQTSPLDALERFAESYVAQRYPRNPPPSLVTRTAMDTLREVLDDTGVGEILGNDGRRLHMVAARLRGAGARSGRRGQMARLAAAATTNIVSRRAIGAFAERVVFHVGEQPVDFGDALPTRYVPLTEENLAPALLASGSIPGLMDPVVDIPGAGEGVYYDGGITDYHFDVAFPGSDGLVLYPHFYPYVVPGWFDKSIPWRRGRAKTLARTLIVAPSRPFVESLPHRKIPDRRDFVTMDDAGRDRYWRRVLAESERLGEEFLELVETGRIRDRVRPLAP
jgi:hypothetical protein